MNRRFRYYTYIQPILRSPIIKSYGLHILTIFTMIIFIIFAIKPTAETAANTTAETLVASEKPIISDEKKTYFLRLIPFRIFNIAK